MKILTIDTTGEFATVAISDTDSNKTVIELSHDVMSHLRLLIPMIQKALDKAGIRKEEITHIAAAAGPGSFTGIRIGLATAKVIAQMMNLPVIQLSSLELYAYADSESYAQNMKIMMLSEDNEIKLEKTAMDCTAKENEPVCEKKIIVPMINARHGNVFASAYVVEDEKRYSKLIEEDLYDTRKLAEKIISESGCSKIIFTADAEKDPFNAISEAVMLTTESEVSAAEADVSAAGAKVPAAEADVSEAEADVSEAGAKAPAAGKCRPCTYVAALSEEQRAQALADMAAAKASAGMTCSYNDLKPVYLRKSEAERKLEEKNAAKREAAERGASKRAAREAARDAAREAAKNDDDSRKAAAQEIIFELPPEDEKITYRNVDERDSEELAKLDSLCFGTAWSKESFDGELDPSKNSIYRAAINSKGKIIGFAGIMCIFDEGEVNRVAVSPLYRGRRIAVKLMSDIIEAAEAKGVKNMFLEVREANRTAIALYKEKGFKVTGKRENYYRETGENALMMKRESAGQQSEATDFQSEKGSECI